MVSRVKLKTLMVRRDCEHWAMIIIAPTEKGEESIEVGGRPITFGRNEQINISEAVGEGRYAPKWT